MKDMLPRLRAVTYDERKHKQWHDGDIWVTPDSRWLDALKALHGVERMGTLTTTAHGFRWVTA